MTKKDKPIEIDLTRKFEDIEKTLNDALKIFAIKGDFIPNDKDVPPETKGRIETFQDWIYATIHELKSVITNLQ